MSAASAIKQLFTSETHANYEDNVDDNDDDNDDDDDENDDDDNDDRVVVAINTSVVHRRRLLSSSARSSLKRSPTLRTRRGLRRAKVNFDSILFPC